MSDRARTQVMDRVRDALRQGESRLVPQVNTAFPGAHPLAQEISQRNLGSVSPSLDSAVPPAQPQVLRERFGQELAAIGGKNHIARSWAEATEAVISLLTTRKVRTLAIGPGKLARTIASGLAKQPDWRQGGKLLWSEATPAALATADVGIAQAELAIANTGTLILRTDKGLFSSLLPPLFIALLPENGIVSDIGEALKRVFEACLAGARFTLVTGPSRTADIEKKLVTGVHGPGELAAIILLGGMDKA